jgi:hypothetical protein
VRSVFALVVVAILAPAVAHAQCSTDMDCKGDRICVNGACRSPATAPPTAAPGAPQNVFADPGWSQGAGILGFVAAGGTLLLAIAAEITKEDQIPSLPIGIGATLLMGVATPVVAVGAGSARGSGKVDGMLGMRIAGWIAYGLSLSDAVVLIGLGLAEVTPPGGIITLVGVLGGAGLIFHALDAMASGSEAEALGARAQGPSVAPIVTMVEGRDRQMHPAVGLGVRF